MIEWTRRPDELAEAAGFFAAVISQDPAYISHGEVQTGLSLDGRSWAADLDARFLEDLAELGPERAVAVARDEGGALAAAAIVLYEETPRTSFIVIEDLAVAPAARSRGLGAEMAHFILADARGRGFKWAFLESGKHNVRAHAFFERVGFEEFSHVFAMRL